jgi:hypothetical protein
MESRRIVEYLSGRTRLYHRPLRQFASRMSADIWLDLLGSTWLLGSEAMESSRPVGTQKQGLWRATVADVAVTVGYIKESAGFQFAG